MSKSITLLIEGHGDEELKTSISVPNVQLLSFTGQTGELGEFGIIDDVSLELHILRFLRTLYLHNEQESVYQSDNLVDGLRTLYENAERSYRNGGFRRTYPRNQRTFYFEPNEHEDCIKCNDVPQYVKYTDGTMRENPVYAQRCIIQRNPNKKLCPVYGLVVVASSDENDQRFALTNARGDIGVDLNTSNIHMNLAAKTYWSRKINKSRFPQASSAFENMIENNRVSLSELSQIFQAMGYTDIYVLDPSCRDTGAKTPSRLTAAVKSVIEQNPRKISRVSDAVTSYATRPSYVTRPSIEDMEPEKNDDLWNTTCKIGSQCWENMFGKTKINGGRKSKKHRKTRNKIFKFTKLNKTTKRRNKNKTRKNKLKNYKV